MAGVRTRVSIVGGGIAGLSLAAALDPTRFDVTVHEAQPGRAATGAALGLWPSARRALGRLGVLDVVERSGGQVSGGYLHDLTGRPLLRAPDVGLLMVARPVLLDALRAALPSSTRLVTEEVLDPRDLDADLVIGADGVRSVVRGLVAPGAADRRATPWVALRGIRDGDVHSSEVGEYWGAGRLFGIVPLVDGRTYWFTAQPSVAGPEPLDPSAVLTEARLAFAGAAPVIRRLLREAGLDTLATRLWVAPPMYRYLRGRYAVIGDAAHAMAPNLGRGACDAIVDAVTLADALQGGRRSGSRLWGWQARRVPLTQAARLASGRLMRVALAEAPRRDRVLRLVQLRRADS